MKTALKTGITGQVGSYRSKFLLGISCQVHGIVCRNSVDRKDRIEHLEGNPIMLAISYEAYLADTY